MAIDNEKILAGRKVVGAYREAHNQLSAGGWYKGMSEDHTPLLEKLVADLEKIGVTSAETEFEPKKTEILAKFFNANESLNLGETGITKREPRQSRYDLSLIGEERESAGVVTERREILGEDELVLIIDGQPAMSTSVKEHLSMEQAVRKCPDNARCFIAGLGLGLVLLYLAESGKAREVIISEIDNRVVDLLGMQIEGWMAEHYPDFSFRILCADAFDRVLKSGEFDWIFFDTNLTDLEASFKETAKVALTTEGIYTPWQPCKVAGWN